MTKMKKKSHVRRSLKKADYFINNAPSQLPYSSKLRPLTSDEKVIINEQKGLNQRKNVKRSNNQFTSEQQKLRRRIEQEILNTGNFSRFPLYNNPSGRNFSSSQMEYSYANPPKMWSEFNQPSNDWFAQDMALKEMMNRYGTEAFTEDEIKNFENRSGVKINYNPSQVNSNTSSLSYGSRNGIRNSAAMKRMSKRQAKTKPSKYFE